MRIALIDDEKSSLDRLCGLINEHVGSKVSIDRFISGEEFMEGFKADIYDLIITDIFMDKLTGIETARKIRKKDKNVKLVFCTSSNEFACESYEGNACYYLRKPYTEESFSAMLDRLELEKLELSRSVKLPDGQSIVLRNVIYADFASHCVTFHNKLGENIVSRVSFADVEPLLCANSYFCSPSKGMIVNFYEVVAQNDNVFVMSDETRIPISRRKAKEVTEAYAEFRFELLRSGGEK